MIKCLKIDLIGDVTITAGGTVVAEIWSQNMKIMGKYHQLVILVLVQIQPKVGVGV